ncbi:hypothetical protein Aple_011160 [Acrocarpospora pleiomorpha]|uniref:DUF3037 domain-containing protein n=1 Tax=Acrocarpospora pleiomorpha TaxID=90975 RepID=A0A5M3XF56_9ACTN|nr:DUF3037 domain-containing protein [Acrocarpospora pleiomorpha]GES18221.1 hypothetical protein Aple_011160 [Acrocarpospora pleiomorpha]
MSRYLYSIIRCLPDPQTGEFVNVGVIAGDPDTGDWAIRRLSNIERIRKFASQAALEVSDRFIARITGEIDDARAAAEADTGEPLGEAWLNRLCRDHRNTVQLSAPAPVLAGHAEAALELIFRSMMIDPAMQPRQETVSRNRAIQDLRDAYNRAEIPGSLLKPRVRVFVGERLHSPIDFAVANGTVVQLTQAWSFQVTVIDDLSTRVKAWGYAIERLRRGDAARLVDAQDSVSGVSSDVDLQIVVVPPKTAHQGIAYEEAQQVFSGLGAAVHTLDDVDAVPARAAALLAARKQRTAD